MDLVPYSDGDLALTRALESDPEVMRELGGPHTEDEIARGHERRVTTTAKGDWWFKIVPDPAGPAVGTIGIWPSERWGAPIHEVGWMVLPAHQGRGIASRALGLLFARVRDEPRFEVVRAFPAVTNGASNALCRKFGFSLTEKDCAVEYRARTLRCNHWELELA